MTCPHCGGALPSAREIQQEHARKMFALQGEARDLGRDIMSAGGSWRRGKYYGAVRATYPEGSRSARNDSWHCHHEHPDDLAALGCALEEVRRLAAGGQFAPCTDYPGCQDRECRIYWPRELRDQGEVA